MWLRRRLLSTGLGLATLVSAAVTATNGVANAQTYSGYAMVYFTESPTMSAASYTLHLAVSTDGLSWMPLNQNAPVATPTQGTQGLRDPFILRKQDNTFVVLATDLNGTDWSLTNQYIHVWDSVDLRSFTGYRRLQVQSRTDTHAWAPEAFWDPGRGQYAIIFSASNGNHDVITVAYTTNFVTTTGTQTFFDPGYHAIDGNMVTYNGTNYMYYKNNTNSTLVGTQSGSLNPGSFSISTGSISPGRGVEAPEIVRSNTSASTFTMWGDTWSPNGRFFAWQTTNLAGGSWSLLNDRQYTQPLNSKHPGIAPITATEYNNLVSRWGAPTWNRIKSYNDPARYVRHANNVGRIDAYPFDPYQDQLWRIVPGLANSTGVSFQSVNFPNMYLRHYNYAVVLNANDNTSTFAADATFYPVSGWADASWTSYRSHNFPDRYLRHSGFVLRIDPVTSGSATTTKQDATFKVVY